MSTVSWDDTATKTYLVYTAPSHNPLQISQGRTIIPGRPPAKLGVGAMVTFAPTAAILAEDETIVAIAGAWYFNALNAPSPNETCELNKSTLAEEVLPRAQKLAKALKKMLPILDADWAATGDFFEKIRNEAAEGQQPQLPSTQPAIPTVSSPPSGAPAPQGVGELIKKTNEEVYSNGLYTQAEPEPEAMALLARLALEEGSTVATYGLLRRALTELSAGELAEIALHPSQTNAEITQKIHLQMSILARDSLQHKYKLEPEEADAAEEDLPPFRGNPTTRAYIAAKKFIEGAVLAALRSPKTFTSDAVRTAGQALAVQLLHEAVLETPLLKLKLAPTGGKAAGAQLLEDYLQAKTPGGPRRDDWLEAVAASHVARAPSQEAPRRKAVLKDLGALTEEERWRTVLQAAAERAVLELLTVAAAPESLEEEEDAPHATGLGASTLHDYLITILQGQPSTKKELDVFQATMLTALLAAWGVRGFSMQASTALWEEIKDDLNAARQHGAAALGKDEGAGPWIHLDHLLPKPLLFNPHKESILDERHSTELLRENLLNAPPREAERPAESKSSMSWEELHSWAAAVDLAAAGVEDLPEGPKGPKAMPDATESKMRVGKKRETPPAKAKGKKREETATKKAKELGNTPDFYGPEQNESPGACFLNCLLAALFSNPNAAWLEHARVARQPLITKIKNLFGPVTRQRNIAEVRRELGRVMLEHAEDVVGPGRANLAANLQSASARITSREYQDAREICPAVLETLGIIVGQACITLTAGGRDTQFSTEARIGVLMTDKEQLRNVIPEQTLLGEEPGKQFSETKQFVATRYADGSAAALIEVDGHLIEAPHIIEMPLAAPSKDNPTLWRTATESNPESLRHLHLRAFCVHRANHYVCFIQRDENWYKYDDTDKSGAFEPVEAPTSPEAWGRLLSKGTVLLLLYVRDRYQDKDGDPLD